MAETPKRQTLSDEQIRTVALETGVNEEDIRMIIDMVGTDRSSIVREARYLKRSR